MIASEQDDTATDFYQLNNNEMNEIARNDW